MTRRLMSVSAVVSFVFPATVLACSIVVIPPKVARTIVVTVTRNGAPARATSVVVADWHTGTPKVIARATTDADGTTTIRELPPGTYRLTSSLWPPFEWETDIEVEGRYGVSPLAIEIQPQPEPPAPVRLSQISGTVVDVTGAVIPNAVVIAEAPDRSRTTLAAGHTDGSGRVNLTVRSDFVILRISTPGFQTAVIPVQLTSAADASPSFRLIMNLKPCGEEKPYWYGMEMEAKQHTEN